MAKPFEVVVKGSDGSTNREKRVVEKLISRRKDKKSRVRDQVEEHAHGRQQLVPA